MKNTISTNSNNNRNFSDMPGYTTTASIFLVDMIVLELLPDIREIADSRTAGIFVRDTVCFHCN